MFILKLIRKEWVDVQNLLVFKLIGSGAHIGFEGSRLYQFFFKKGEKNDNSKRSTKDYNKSKCW